MKYKSEVLEKFKEWEAAVTNQAECKIKTLQTDNGGEYMSKEFEDFLKEKGIRHETTVPHSSQQNGIAKHMNRTLQEAALSMILHGDLSKAFWAEAVCNAAYVRNRVITTAVTPYQRWYGKKPDVSNLRVFGCTVYAHVPDASGQKFDQKAVKMRFVGYSLTQKGYRLYDENRQRIFIRRDITFNEMEFGSTNVQVKCDEDITECTKEEMQLKGEEGITMDDQNSRKDSRRSGRERNPPMFYHVSTLESLKRSMQPSMIFIAEIEEPETLKDALDSEYATQWKAVADAEYQSPLENETWELVELPPGHKPISCKRVFNVKHDETGKVERFKGRLVAKGFLQKYGIDYDETFSPVVHFSSICALLAFGVSQKMLIDQMDVVTAFLNGTFDKEIYMQQSEGYVEPGKEELVCCLKKSLYGLKQSARCWNNVLKEFMISLGFVQSVADPCAFIHVLNCPGVSVTIKDGVLQISQEQYISKILRKYKIQDCKTE